MDPERAAAVGAPRLLAASLLVLVGLTGATLAGLGNPDPDQAWLVIPVAVAVVTPGVVGLLILRSRQGHVVAWLLLAHAALVGFAMATPPEEPHGTLGLSLGQVTQGAWVGLYVCLVLIGYLFPDGRALSPRWRTWVIVCMSGYAAFVVGAATSTSGFHDFYPDRDPPLPVLPSAVGGVLSLGGLALVAASLVGTVVCARQRLRGSSGDERLRLLWFAWAALSIPMMLGVCIVDNALTGETGVITVVGISILGSTIPIGIGIAILRFRLFDIELVLSRTLTYGGLTVVVIGTYGLVLWGARALFGPGSVAGFVGVAVVAVAVQPAHQFLRRRAEHWVYGDRSDPVAALRRLSDRVEQTADPALVVQSVTDSVVEALRLERAWIELARDDLPPRPGDRVVRIPLSHRGRRLGDLAVEVPPGHQLSAADTTLLHDLARHAAVVVDAVHLTLDLQRSRARLVSTREEERRRLRRDLHDGLGPSLAAIVLKLNAVEKRADAVERNRLLAEARAETKAAIDEVRRLVDDLRPPAIDEVGLVGAIRQRAAGLSRDDLVIDVGGPAVLPPLPAAVEVAAFRIASEAMTNVTRHSGATHCTVHLAVNGALELTVTDNGSGPAVGTPSGVGWTSMRERAAELGGSCTISSRSQGGTVVRAVLPLPATATESVEEAAR
jgi:two-component system NarL family sensor kinase